MSLWQTILATVALIAALFTAWVYWRQLNVMQTTLQTMQDAIKAQNLTALIQYLQASDVRGARHRVLHELRDTEYGKWNEDDKERAASACAAYDVAGVLIRTGRVDGDVILDTWGPSIVQTIDRCQQLISEKRAATGDERYWSALLWLYDEAKRRFRGEVARAPGL